MTDLQPLADPLIHNLVHFTRLLRAQGLRGVPETTVAMLEAAEAVVSIFAEAEGGKTVGQGVVAVQVDDKALGGGLVVAAGEVEIDMGILAPGAVLGAEIAGDTQLLLLGIARAADGGLAASGSS